MSRRGGLRLLLLTLLWATMTRAGLAMPVDLSQGWLFHKSDLSGAEQSDFNDKDWRSVVVPHDWSIMDKPDGTPPFDATAESGQDSGYLPGGIGWYRRHLDVSATEARQTVTLRFEAVYMDAEIWINGKKLATHHYGYTAFTVDLTGHLRTGDNVIAVRVNHADPSSRWYAGSGILRPVTLDITPCAHIEPDSLFVTTPLATPDKGLISVRATVKNGCAKSHKVEWLARVEGANEVSLVSASRTKPIAARQSSALDMTLSLMRPNLWSPETPNLYTLVYALNVDGKRVDERRVRFGMRTITVDAVKGLRVNGQPYVLKGGNIHHDNYMLGGAGFADADRRKVSLMKAAGYNAIRNAHNPASQATLEAADELGMLVIDEAFDAWAKDKRPKDYARFFAADWQNDIDSLVLSGRNHPSVLFWSIGNEIPEQGTPEGVARARALAQRVRTLDPTRPITQAISIDPPGSDLQFGSVDIASYNYRAHLFGQDHERFANRVMLTSESTPKDAFAYWRPVETMPWVIGDFVWTSFDYMGESGIGWMGYSQDWQKLAPYPWNLAYSGEIDATGRKRPAAYYREVLWKSGIDPISAFVHQPEGTEDLPDRHLYPVTQPHLDWSLDDVHPSWTWPGLEGKRVDVEVYSEFPVVELFLNAQSLGRKTVDVSTQYKALYSLPYQPGELTAVGYREGREGGRWTLFTAGDAFAAKVSSDRPVLRANGEDLAYVEVALIDHNGVETYAQKSDRKLKILVTGQGTLAGVGNGDPHDVSSFQSGVRQTFHGRLVAVVRAGTQPGPIDVTVVGDGLAEQHLRLQTLSP